VFNFSQWEGKTIHELAYDHRPRGLYFLDFITGPKFDLASRPDLISALRSLNNEWYTAHLYPSFAKGLAKRGFKRFEIEGSVYECAKYPKNLNPHLQWYLSCEKTPFDHFIELEAPYKATVWTHKKPEVTFDAEPLAALRPESVNTGQGMGWEAYPIRLSFFGVPIRIERLYIDDPEKKKTYLTVLPAGLNGNYVASEFLYLTMELNEEGKSPGWAEKILGLPFHFSGALCSTYCVDIVDAHFEKVEDESVIRTGLRFEMRGVIAAVDEGKISVKLDWQDPRLLEDEGNRETMHMTLHEGVEAPVVGGKYLIKGILPPLGFQGLVVVSGDLHSIGNTAGYRMGFGRLSRLIALPSKLSSSHAFHGVLQGCVKAKVSSHQVNQQCIAWNATSDNKSTIEDFSARSRVGLISLSLG